MSYYLIFFIRSYSSCLWYGRMSVKCTNVQIKFSNIITQFFKVFKVTEQTLFNEPIVKVIISNTIPPPSMPKSVQLTLTSHRLQQRSLPYRIIGAVIIPFRLRRFLIRATFTLTSPFRVRQTSLQPPNQQNRDHSFQ